MNRKGYLGHGIFRPGGTVPARIGDLVVSNIPRATGLGSHVVNIKRQNITLDAATILARIHGFVTPQTEVGLSGARDQYFGATSPDHAAHAVKRFTFNNKSIVDVYTRPGVDEVAIVGLQTMLGLVTDVHRRANLSIVQKARGKSAASRNNSSLSSLPPSETCPKHVSWHANLNSNGATSRAPCSNQ